MLEQALRVVGIAQKQFGVFRSRVPDAGSFMPYLKELEVVADAAAASVAGTVRRTTPARLRLSAWTQTLESVVVVGGLSDQAFSGTTAVDDSMLSRTSRFRV